MNIGNELVGKKIMKPKNTGENIKFQIDGHSLYTVAWTDYRFYSSKIFFFFFQRHLLENLKQLLTWSIIALEY